MPSREEARQHKHVLFYETMGTLFLSVAVNFTNYNPFAMGFTYFLMYMLAEGVSGAMFNPAFSVGMLMMQDGVKKNYKFFNLLFTFQLIGALGGILIAFFVFHEEGVFDMYTFIADGAPFEEYRKQNRMLQVIFIEFILSSVFVASFLITRYIYPCFNS